MSIFADGFSSQQHRSMNFWDCSDPYVEVSCGKATRKTNVVDNNLNPEFNEIFTFTAGPADQLDIKLWDSDAVKADDLLGTLSIPLFKLKSGETYHQWCEALAAHLKRESEGVPSLPQSSPASSRGLVPPYLKFSIGLVARQYSFSSRPAGESPAESPAGSNLQHPDLQVLFDSSEAFSDLFPGQRFDFYDRTGISWSLPTHQRRRSRKTKSVTRMPCRSGAARGPRGFMLCSRKKRSPSSSQGCALATGMVNANAAANTPSEVQV